MVRVRECRKRDLLTPIRPPCKPIHRYIGRSWSIASSFGYEERGAGKRENRDTEPRRSEFGHSQRQRLKGFLVKTDIPAWQTYRARIRPSQKGFDQEQNTAATLRLRKQKRPIFPADLRLRRKTRPHYPSAR